MNRFSRIRHHVSVEDVKKKHLESIAVENFIKTEEEISKTISEKFKHDWRKELEEGMTTSNALSTVLPAEGEVAIDQVSPVDSASFADVNNMFGSGADNPALDGATIRASGSGSGSDGGFNVGGDYLAFQGSGSGSRMALLKPMDATKVDTLTITAIRGNDSNGGEDPDIVGQEELFVIYKTPEMSRSSYLSQDRSQNNIGSFPADAAIIAIGQGDGTLQNYTITIPEYARQKDTVFGLFQLSHSGTGFDHYGVTDIKFQRKTPINVVVPLDSPEAISFVRVGTNEGDPKKRKKKINDQLAASDEYTSQQMGGEFPGQGARIDGEDPFKSAEVQDVAAPSPLGKSAVKRTFQDFKNLTDQQKANQSNEYLNDYIKTFSDGTYNDPESLEILDRAIEINPKNTDAYFYRSFAYFDNQNYDDALADTERILELNPNDPDIPYMRAMIYREKGDLELSLQEIKKSLETYPDDPYLEDMKAEVEGQIEQEYRAKQVPPDANEEGGVVKRQTYYDEVSKNLAPEETEDQQIVDTNLAQAKDLMNTTHYGRGRDGVFSKGAVDLLQDALKVEPNNPEILSNLGVAMLMDRYSSSKEGIEHLERAQALDPNVKFDFGINSWDEYDDQFSASDPAYSGSKIERLGSLPYRYARGIIKSLPDQSTAKGAKHGSVDSDYAKKYGGSYSQYYTDEAKGKSTELLQRMLVSAARKIENNKYWMNDLSSHPSFRGNVIIVGAPGYVLGGTKFTGATNGVTQKDFDRENSKLQAMLNPPYVGDWRSQNEKVNKISYQLAADRKIKGINASVKMDVEKYKAYYDEYMRRGEPDAIEKVDVPEAGKFIETAQKEIIEKAISEPEKLFKLSKEQGETLRKVLTPQGGKGGNSLEYTANLPFALGISILTGKPMELFVSDAEAIKIAQDINADELAKVLRIDNPVPTTAREAIEPSEGKTDKVITSLFGKQGGLYFNYDTETKQLYIESRKTLRSTSGGEEVTDFFSSEPPINPKTGEPFPDMYADKNADLKSIIFTLPALTGTGSKFSDIPVPTTDEINQIGAKFVFDYVYGPFMKAKATFDALKKTGGNPIEIKNVIFDGLAGKIENPDQLNPNAPRTAWNEKAGKMMNDYDYAIAGMKQHFDKNFISKTVVEIATKFMSANVNAIAANTVAIRKILTDLGIPASDIEKFGGAHGMTYSSTPVNFDDLPDEVKKVIEAAVGSPQGKPKPKPESEPRSGLAGLDEPIIFDKDKKNNKKNNVKESTLFERVKSKQFFNPKDIKPTFPENPPPEIDKKTGMHPNYGKQAKRYNKLDPISANSMPPTGDPEIDAVVDKQRTKKKPSERKQDYIKTVDKIKKMAKKS